MLSPLRPNCHPARDLSQSPSRIDNLLESTNCRVRFLPLKFSQLHLFRYADFAELIAFLSNELLDVHNILRDIDTRSP